jgi:hypothetical protein
MEKASESAGRIADGWKAAADRLGDAFESLEAKVNRSSPKGKAGNGAALRAVKRTAHMGRSPDIPALALARVTAAAASSKAASSVASARTAVDGLSVANAERVLRPAVRARRTTGASGGGGDTEVSVDLLGTEVSLEASPSTWRSSTLSSSRSQRVVSHVLDKILELLHRKECRLIDLFRSHRFNVDIDDQGKDKTAVTRGAWLGAKAENMEFDLGEWKNLLAAAGLHLTRREMVQVFQSLDKDHSHAIDIEEMELGLHRHKLKLAVKHEAEHDPIARLAMKVRAGLPVAGALVHTQTVKRVARQHRDAVRTRNFAPAGSPARPRVGAGAVRKMPGNLNSLNSTRLSAPPRGALSPPTALARAG